MQDRYAGDVGDFGKYALLRALGEGRKVGLCWYLTSGEGEGNNDGSHTAYLEAPDRFRHLDPGLFEALRTYVSTVRRGVARRAVTALEALELLPSSTRYHRTLLPVRADERERWSQEMVASMRGADLVLLDPDNGLEWRRLSHKCASLSELSELRVPGRALLLYQHQTRMRGGAAAEVKMIASRLEARGFKDVQAIRFRPYSSRYYFLLDGTPALVKRLDALASRWGEDCVRFRP